MSMQQDITCAFSKLLEPDDSVIFRSVHLVTVPNRCILDSGEIPSATCRRRPVTLRYLLVRLFEVAFDRSNRRVDCDYSCFMSRMLINIYFLSWNISERLFLFLKL